MFDGEIYTNQEDDRFSSSREAVIDSIMRHIIDHGITQTLTEEVYAQTSLKERLSDYAPTIIKSLYRSKEVIKDEDSVELSTWLSAGMAFACWTHDIENSPNLKENLYTSLEYSVSYMLQTAHRAVGERDLYAQYETTMEHIDAVDALQDCIDQERELVDYCAGVAEPSSERMRAVFKMGYGFIRHAVLFPYSIGHERRSYNLNLMGILAATSERYLQYARDDLVFESNDDDTQRGRSELALAKLQDDEYIKTYFQKGQHLSLVAGICKTVTPSDRDFEDQYHVLGRGDQRYIITGEFQGFAADNTLTDNAIAALNKRKRTKASDIASFEAIPFAAVSIILSNPAVHSAYPGNSNGYTPGSPILQKVTIPLDIPDQQIIYHK